MIEIVLGGDICPIGRAGSLLASNAGGEVFGELINEIGGADIAIANLECPLVTIGTPIEKAGPVLSAPVAVAKGIAQAGFSAVNLANNHSFDHGKKGLLETVKVLEAVGVESFGAGSSIEEARRPFRRCVAGREIVFIGMAEREFSFADEQIGGANPLDIIEAAYALRQRNAGCIFIVLIHGGQEHYGCPSPDMVKRCRFLVDMGADAVICCHTHCPVPWEFYKGKPVVYGMGNLLFQWGEAMPRDWHEGYLVKLFFDENGCGMEIIPYLQCMGDANIRRMNNDEANAFRCRMEALWLELVKPGALEKRWAEYCEGRKIDYLAGLFGYPRWMRRLRRVAVPLLHSKAEVMNSLHYVQCETHAEVLRAILRKLRGRI